MNDCLHNSVVHTTGYFGNWSQCSNLACLRRDVFEIGFEPYWEKKIMWRC